MILRYCICIPTYNNPEMIQDVVRDCLDRTPYPILIIDDGSDEPVHVENTRVSIVRLETNQGKGAALQRAFKECLKSEYTHMISLDGDGQHLASEISKLTAVSLENPWDMIIGSRKMVSENVPSISKFGRKFSNFWVQFQTNSAVSDSQSGFRIYPLFHVQNMKFWTRKFDFEIEVLIRLLWKNVTVREQEIECFYPAREERVSHFHKFWDNLRISLLNTLLVILSLLRTHHTPKELALAVGVGVWVGTTPFFGFHTLIVAAIAFVFRLNAAYLWLGTQVSIAPLAPLLAIASIKVGKFLLKKTTTGSLSALRFSWDWFAGSLFLGAALGLVLGLIAYFVAKRFERNATKKKAAWNGRSRGGKFGNTFLKYAIRYAGLRATYGLLYFIVPYFYFFAPKARLASNEYWSILYPKMNWIKRQAYVLRHLYRFAQTLLDRVYQGFHEEPQFQIHSHGMEHILNQGALIMMSAHAGSWTLAAFLLKADGLNTRFHTVEYESQGMTFDKARNQEDPEHLKKLISNRISVFEIRKLLEQGLPVGMMGDRPIGNQFELISFLGKLAPFDCSPFKIAAACKVPLLVTFGFKADPKADPKAKKMAYDFYATPAKLYHYDSGPDAENKALQTLAWARSYTQELEKKIRKYPEQWFNFFPFWSTLPTPPEDAPESAKEARVRNYSLEELRTPLKPKAASVLAPTQNGETLSQP
jgi:predicted LPLAT superfamily acyltransferase/glycosyltransferase involved in cell wall biosynthesis